MDVQIRPLTRVPEEIWICRDPTSNHAGWVAVQEALRPYPAQPESPDNISQASCWMALAAVLNIRLHICGVSLSRSGTAFTDLLVRMGISIREEVTTLAPANSIGNLDMRGGTLKGIVVPSRSIPLAPQDLAILAVLANFAEGKTIIRGFPNTLPAQKTFLGTLCAGLRQMNSDIEECEDGLCVTGSRFLRGADLPTGGDSRLVAAFFTAALLARGDSIVRDRDAAASGLFQSLWKTNFIPLD